MLFETEKYFLLSHLRMEGKYFLKNSIEPIEKHEHVMITFEDNTTLRYHDTRKFGRMKLVLKDKVNEFEGIKKQGIEPMDEALTKEYLYEKFHKHNLPTKLFYLTKLSLVVLVIFMPMRFCLPPVFHLLKKEVKLR